MTARVLCVSTDTGAVAEWTCPWESVAALDGVLYATSEEGVETLAADGTLDAPASVVETGILDCGIPGLKRAGRNGVRLSTTDGDGVHATVRATLHRHGHPDRARTIANDRRLGGRVSSSFRLGTGAEWDGITLRIEARDGEAFTLDGVTVDVERARNTT